MKYIVTYLIVRMLWTPCPSVEPYRDEFGRTHYSNYTTLGICYKKDTAEMKKEFSSRVEAERFILRGKGVYDSTSIERQKGSFGYLPGFSFVAPDGELSNFKLDSIPLTTAK